MDFDKPDAFLEEDYDTDIDVDEDTVLAVSTLPDSNYYVNNREDYWKLECW